MRVADQLDEALLHYNRAKDHGIERAAMHIRNVGAKIVGKRLKEEEGKNN